MTTPDKTVERLVTEEIRAGRAMKFYAVLLPSGRWIGADGDGPPWLWPGTEAGYNEARDAARESDGYLVRLATSTVIPSPSHDRVCELALRLQAKGAS